MRKVITCGLQGALAGRSESRIRPDQSPCTVLHRGTQLLQVSVVFLTLAAADFGQPADARGGVLFALVTHRESSMALGWQPELSTRPSQTCSNAIVRLDTDPHYYPV